MIENETASPPRAAHAGWIVVAALAFAASAVIAAPLAGLEISAEFGNTRGEVTWLTMFAGVFLTGCLFWWLLVVLPRRFSAGRGAAAGVLVAFFCYPVVLTLTDIFQRGDALDASNFEARGGNILIASLLTLVSTGFAFTLILGLVGAVIALLLQRRHPEALPSSGRIAGGLALLVVLFLGGLFALLMLIPIDTAGLKGAPAAAAAMSYDEAVTAVDAVRAAEAELPLNPRCLSTLLTHGGKVERVVVYFHGLTNCPAQAELLGAQLFALGYNVYLPRIPQHGEADQMSLALQDLTAEQMMDTANQATDIARGLGDEVVITGLSAGGIMSAWLAQYRADADQSNSIAPFFSPALVPRWAHRAVTNLLLNLPNMMVWWDPRLQDNPPGMTYAYPRFATRGLAQALRLSTAVVEAAQAVAPLSPGPAMLLNAGDEAVSNSMSEEIVAGWRAHGADVNVVVMPTEVGIGHDLIDPHQPDANPDLVHGVMIDMMNGVEPKFTTPSADPG